MDVDGTLTTSHMYYNKDGKYLKAFGPDDFDLIDIIKRFFDVKFITADKKGFDIVKKRLVDEMNLDLNLVSRIAKDRANWMKKISGDKFIFFIGDGWADFECLKQANYGITFPDSLEHVKECADFITKHSGGNRGVAEAIIHICDRLKINLFDYA